MTEKLVAKERLSRDEKKTGECGPLKKPEHAIHIIKHPNNKFN